MYAACSSQPPRHLKTVTIEGILSLCTEEDEWDGMEGEKGTQGAAIWKLIGMVPRALMFLGESGVLGCEWEADGLNAKETGKLNKR